jgi:hypothetical protein
VLVFWLPILHKKNQPLRSPDTPVLIWDIDLKLAGNLLETSARPTIRLRWARVKLPLADVEERFPNNCDNRRFRELSFAPRPDSERKLCACLTKYYVANLARDCGIADAHHDEGSVLLREWMKT